MPEGGLNTQVNLTASVVEVNEAAGRGGGAYVTGELDGDPRSRITGNAGLGVGGGIWDGDPLNAKRRSWAAWQSRGTCRTTASRPG